MPHRGATLASRLLSMIVARRIVERDQLATELRVPPALVEQWLRDTQPIPSERQLLLAAFVIERMPSLARHGYRLRDHVRATMAYHAHATQTHLIAPVPRFKPLRGGIAGQRPR